jgi:hypothetical protein
MRAGTAHFSGWSTARSSKKPSDTQRVLDPKQAGAGR